MNRFLICLLVLSLPLLCHACVGQYTVNNDAQLNAALNAQGSWSSSTTTVICFRAGRYTLPSSARYLTKPQKWIGPLAGVDATCGMNPKRANCNRLASLPNAANGEAYFTPDNVEPPIAHFIVQSDFTMDGFTVISRLNTVAIECASPDFLLNLQNNVLICGPRLILWLNKAFLEFNYFGPNMPDTSVQYIGFLEGGPFVMQYNYFADALVGLIDYVTRTPSDFVVIQYNTFVNVVKAVTFRNSASLTFKGNMLLESRIQYAGQDAGFTVIITDNTFAYNYFYSIEINYAPAIDLRRNCFIDNYASYIFGTTGRTVAGNWFGVPYPWFNPLDKDSQSAAVTPANAPVTFSLDNANTYYSSIYSPTFSPLNSCPASFSLSVAPRLTKAYWLVDEQIFFDYNFSVPSVFTSRGHNSGRWANENLQAGIASNNSPTSPIDGRLVRGPLGSTSLTNAFGNIYTPSTVNTTQAGAAAGYRLVLFTRRLRAIGSVICIYQTDPVATLSFSPSLYDGQYMQQGQSYSITATFPSQYVANLVMRIVQSNGVSRNLGATVTSSPASRNAGTVNNLINGITARVEVVHTLRCQSKTFSTFSSPFMFNRNPIATAQTFAVDPSISGSATFSFVMTSFTSDPDSGDSVTITYNGAATPRGGRGTRTSYSPPPNFIGSDTLTYTFRDQRGGTGSGTITFTVRNPAIIAYSRTGGQRTNGRYQSTQNIQLSARLAFDFITVSIVLVDSTNTAVTRHIASVNAGDSTAKLYNVPLGQIDGRIVWQVRFSGTLVASGNSSNIPYSFTDTVMFGVNRPPVAQNDIVYAIGTGTRTIQVRANDSDPDGDTLSVTAITQPPAARGSATFTSTTVTFTPNPSYSGNASFTYTVSDGFGGSSTATVVAIVCIDSVQCRGRGVCKPDATCQCNTGFNGAGCGTCQPNYYGPNCIFCSASTNCSNAGQCNSSGLCQCRTGFTGTNCNSCIADHYGPNCQLCTPQTTCNGNGVCDTATGGCICDNPGFNATRGCSNCAGDHYGPNCTYCSDSLCNGHGSCNNEGLCACNDGFDPTNNCTGCLPGYFGPNCVECSNTTTCNGNGICSSAGGCDCVDGYDVALNCSVCMVDHYGTNCSYCIDSLCNGHGLCNNDGRCGCEYGFDSATNCSNCAHGYFGPNCECLQTETCNDHGTCVEATGACECDSGFDIAVNCSLCMEDHYGANCTYCLDSFCGDFGQCDVNGRCVCESQGHDPAANCTLCLPGDYYGAECKYCVDSMCNGHGTCSNSAELCLCDTGFDPSSNCSTCLSGYYGDTCFECSNSTCNYHGSCDMNGRCICDSGYDSLLNCSTCADDHYNFPLCTYCKSEIHCNFGTCSDTGCDCYKNFDGANCTACSNPEEFTYPTCAYCIPEILCHNHGTCDSEAVCTCYPGYDESTNCSSCVSDHFENYNLCIFCEASVTCTGNGVCNGSGVCECFDGFDISTNCSTCASDYYLYPTCTYCDEETCHGNGRCSNATTSNFTESICQCLPNFDVSSNCSTCVPPFAGLNCSLVCDSALNCGGNGDCTTNGTCECREGWEGHNCSTVVSYCNVSALFVPRPGGTWIGTDNSSYTLYDIVVTNHGNESIRAVYLYLGDASEFSQFWNLDTSNQNDSFVFEGKNVTAFDLLNFYEISPSASFNGAGVVAVDHVPFVSRAGCLSDGRLVAVPSGCDGLLVTSNMVEGSTYVENGVPHTQYTVTVTNIGRDTVLDIFVNISTTEGSHIQDLYNLNQIDNSTIYQYNIFGNPFTPGMSHESSGFTLANAGGVYVRCSSSRIFADAAARDARGRDHTGAIVGGVIGGVVGLAMVAGLVALLIHKNKAAGHQPVGSFATTITGGKKKPRFGLEDLGSGYSSTNVRGDNPSPFDSEL